MNNNYNKDEYEEAVETKVKELNFRLLVKQLKEDYKLKVCLGECNPIDIFQISESSNDYLIRLIKSDVKTKLPVPKTRNWLKDFKNKFLK